MASVSAVPEDPGKDPHEGNAICTVERNRGGYGEAQRDLSAAMPLLGEALEILTARGDNENIPTWQKSH